ncbi:MAG: DUF4173 domain-containing protein [Owenweeksia sp.]
MNFVIQSTFKNSKQFNQAFFTACLTFIFLFHKAGIGLNLALFSFLIAGHWFIQKRESFRLNSVRIATLATIISALSVAWYGTGYTVLWAIISLAILSEQIHYPRSSILFSEIKTLLRLVLAPLYGLTHLLGFKENQSTELRQTRFLKVLTFVILPVTFTFLFATIYKNLNPIFEKAYFRFLNMMDHGLILTIALGIMVTSIIFIKAIPSRLLALDRWLSNGFKLQSPVPKNAAVERQGGLILFALLNSTLLIFLISDVFFIQDIYNGNTAAHYAQYVHQGVGLLIFSIIIAMALILFYFRNSGNSSLPNNNLLKVLAITWVFLNLGIICTTGAKNLIYVSEYALTLKRIGVFIYLSLAVAGLSATLVKVFQKKTNAFLFRKLYWAFFAILILNSCVDWSTIIVRYNIRQHIENKQELDWYYLLSLDIRTLPHIDTLRNQIVFSSSEEKGKFTELLNHRREELRNYEPEWRDIHMAKAYAKSYYTQP